MRPEKLSSAATEIFEQLKTAQIVIFDLEQKSTYKIGLRFIGDTHLALQTQIKTQLGRNFELVSGTGCDLLVLIRTNGRLKDIILSDYGSLKTPHLLLDVAFDHSISIGPLVFPGDTACLSCLVGRLTTYWGDAIPPLMPTVQKNPALIAGLLVMELHKILSLSERELVNNAVAYDFENYKVKKNSVYKLPQCPVCGISVMDNPGAIKLPWGKT